MVFIEATLAIDAVEGADLTVGRQQVDAQRDAKAAAVNRAEDGRWIIVLLLSTETFALGQYWLRRRMVSAIISAKWG